MFGSIEQKIRPSQELFKRTALNFFHVDTQGRLRDVKKVLEQKIGVSLDELDDYLHVYKFGPETLMSMVGYYMDEGDPNPQSFEEIAGEVDGFLWTFAETGSIEPDTFISLVKVLLQA